MKTTSAFVIIFLGIVVVSHAADLGNTMYCQNMSAAYKFLMCNGQGVTPQTVALLRNYGLTPGDVDVVKSTVVKDKAAGKSCDYSNDYNASHNLFFRHCLQVTEKVKY